jgi:hypothetical protein
VQQDPNAGTTLALPLSLLLAALFYLFVC